MITMTIMQGPIDFTDLSRPPSCDPNPFTPNHAHDALLGCKPRIPQVNRLRDKTCTRYPTGKVRVLACTDRDNGGPDSDLLPHSLEAMSPWGLCAVPVGRAPPSHMLLVM